MLGTVRLRANSIIQASAELRSDHRHHGEATAAGAGSLQALSQHLLDGQLIVGQRARRHRIVRAVLLLMLQIRFERLRGLVQLLGRTVNGRRHGQQVLLVLLLLRHEHRAGPLVQGVQRGGALHWRRRASVQQLLLLLVTGRRTGGAAGAVGRRAAGSRSDWNDIKSSGELEIRKLTDKLSCGLMVSAVDIEFK